MRVLLLLSGRGHLGTVFDGGAEHVVGRLPDHVGDVGLASERHEPLHRGLGHVFGAHVHDAVAACVARHVEIDRVASVEHECAKEFEARVGRR